MKTKSIGLVLLLSAGAFGGAATTTGREKGGVGVTSTHLMKEHRGFWLEMGILREIARLKLSPSCKANEFFLIRLFHAWN